MKHIGTSECKVLNSTQQKEIYQPVTRSIPSPAPTASVPQSSAVLLSTVPKSLITRTQIPLNFSVVSKSSQVVFSESSPIFSGPPFVRYIF